ncbi:phosphoribosylformylglycinamidine synthase fgam [Lucifera butyrica]|uniref:Phosphoribosylformylglycinamidine synthase fgam n=1 Tax=Lucifera butyrica TaxID=1351585 RepID=A0A498R5B9_9FIRM|nr:phosphoribosylformylglycinamidine synthase [Lucifera butyrica]VBB06349.1 phosphoribosylformylglycinamidine synthase fgam [Lucifera butyrica]
MSQSVRRVYVEKKPAFAVEAQGIFADLREHLNLQGLTGVRLLRRYDMAGLSEAEYRQALYSIFAEAPVDVIYEETLPLPPAVRVFAVEYLPGQYDQRADSAAQCVQLLTQQERPVIATANVYLLAGTVSDAEFNRVKAYLINPVEAREAGLEKPVSLAVEAEVPPDVAVLQGFTAYDEEDLRRFWEEEGLAMSLDDLAFCREYFRDQEKRDPALTEIKVIDTYWSDHCRHTTFLTKIQAVSIDDGRYALPVREAYQEYLQGRQQVYAGKERDMSLMDIALVGMKELKKQGMLRDLDESEEINACSIVVDVDVNGQNEEWLVMFKNETHNHPTEIEPFGGAATCLGGAIRDPLSGRSYVYQAMRITGSADPRTPYGDTLPGKLPQRKITVGAAAGYSSYGNQIGLATGQVVEVYDEDFVAKRMEIGAVIGAVPRRNVKREQPVPGDAVILVGGRTGRDGCGGATGSSKEHTAESLASCGAEVQKGNPPTERKIQRLFRRPEVSRLVKKCNDFGAGGVAVAIGELSDGLAVQLDAVPKKYAGLDGTELAISESQERMAVVVAAGDVDVFCTRAADENLEATVVARVTADRRLRMTWRGRDIVNISRDFLNTNGVLQTTRVRVKAPDEKNNYFSAVNSGKDEKSVWLANLQDLNVCSQQGLVERFDSTIGAGTVLMPFGGRFQATPAAGMAAKIPLLQGETDTATLMTFGYNPRLSKWSPFHGALYAVVEAVAKVAALGGDYRRVRLTLQEYFEKLGKDEEKWGKPFSALLGAYYAQKRLGIPAIGGKDSMSGTFMDLTVPPTLVAFAVGIADAKTVVSQEFKEPGNPVVLVPLFRDEGELPDFEQLDRNYTAIYRLARQGKVRAANPVGTGGVAAAVSKMCFGNRIGVNCETVMEPAALYRADYGSILLEMDGNTTWEEELQDISYVVLGQTSEEPVIRVNDREIGLTEAQAAWQQPLAAVFPTRTVPPADGVPAFAPFGIGGELSQQAGNRGTARPRVLIPVFPGTNCEYDSARTFEAAGGQAEMLVIRNLSPADVEESIRAMVDKIKQAQIIMLPGGFSAGDEPDGSGKFIATMFRNPRIKEAVREFLQRRDGLMLGICNGFQALIKLGLVPYGDIVEINETSPTLTYNSIGRHVSRMATTRIVSNRSPWLRYTATGDMHTIPVSHGEGRFVATMEEFSRLSRQGQIATQYVNFAGEPAYEIEFNPNGSYQAVEGITSPDGRILGKMGHSERIGSFVGKNVPGNKDQRIFAAGIDYFR